MAAAKDRSSKRRAKDGDAEPSKKKAKTQSEPAQGQVVFRVESDDAPVGPVLAEMAEFEPSSTDFALYSAPSYGSNGSESEKSATMNDRLLLAGDTPKIQYLSSNWGWGASSQAPPDLRRETRGYAGEYLLGVYDKQKKQVNLRAVPVFTINRSIKALANVSAMAVESGADSGFDYSRARRDLGEAFGNKKQKQAARNMDRMKVNTENMDDVLEHVASGIDESVSALPSENELAAALNVSRALPRANLEAEDPADVYALDTILPPTVRKALSTKPLLACQSQSELGKTLRSLPHPSPWLLPRLWEVVQTAQRDGSGSKAAELVQVGYYMALLLAFRRQARVLGKGNEDPRATLAHKMRLPEREKEVVLDDLLSRFAETPRGSQAYVQADSPRPMMTATSDTKLFAVILVLALYMDNFSVAPQQLAQELSVPTQRYVAVAHTQSQRTVSLVGMHLVAVDAARCGRGPGGIACRQAVAPQDPARVPTAAEARPSTALGS